MQRILPLTAAQRTSGRPARRANGFPPPSRDPAPAARRMHARAIAHFRAFDRKSGAFLSDLQSCEAERTRRAARQSE